MNDGYFQNAQMVLQIEKYQYIQEIYTLFLRGDMELDEFLAFAKVELDDTEQYSELLNNINQES